MGEGGLCPGKVCPEGSLSRGSLSKGVSVQEDLCPGGSLSMGGLCPGGFLSRGVSVQEGLCRGGLCPRGLCPRGLCLGISVRGDLCPERSLSGRPPCTVTCGRYASYWNAFLFSLNFVAAQSEYWILYEAIWKLCSFRFRTNINEP